LSRELRVDPLTGRVVAMAPGRSARPGASAPSLDPVTDKELGSCPFCEGHEGRTPPEVFALPLEGRTPDAPGWSVRVVPNLYPAFERQEVVVHTPRHARSFAELADVEVEAIATAWSVRAEAAAAEGFNYVHPLINEGRAAGASLAHSHSQLVWLREPPPAVREERPGGLLDLLQAAREQQLIVDGTRDLVAFCHPAGRLPYETMIASEELRQPWPDPPTLTLALTLMRNMVSSLQRIEGLVPWNAWLHHGRDWHIELVPRLAVLAGIELGAGIYVNTLRPEEAAQALRG
jgi:UDPglucose--hexose-1-phosphate uridylyltransferase